MADSSPESLDRSESLSLKHLNSSLFSIPGFFVGFGSRGSSESNQGKSPTSPLDFGVFSNFGGLFPRSPVWSSPKYGRRNKWTCSKVGLSIVNSLADETESSNIALDDSPKSENLVLARQIKVKISKKSRNFSELLGRSLKSNSLPKNYVASSLSDTTNHLDERGEPNVVLGDEGKLVEPSLSVKPPSSMKPGSSPMNIASGHGYSRSLSAREMTLSEDYTCIISHGPNPKTTHIFGDQVLDCNPNELEIFDTKEDAESPNEDLKPNPSDESLSFCSSCKKKPEDDHDIYINRDEKALCSSNCRSYEISAEETVNTDDDSLDISPVSSFQESIFSMGMPLIS